MSLPTLYQTFIHKSRYARWKDEEKRRENWAETVDRYLKFMNEVQCPGKIPPEVLEELRAGIMGLDVMPSMRCMMTAGKALQKDNVAGYNCSYVAIDDPKAFDEMLYILMCGTGVGFSVERQFVAKMPVVAEKLRPSKTIIKVDDSKIGWADAFRELISMLYQGRIPQWDVSEVRPAGARLKTFGGRASGPDPLVDLFKFTVDIFKGAEGRRLNSIECHDICCKIGDIVVVGGVRRSALISLSNPSDDRMRHAKSGQWWTTDPHRHLANNSACYTEKPGMDVFFREWLALYESKSGERGIFNREAAKKQAAKYGRRNPEFDFGTNPCSEIILRSCGLCNLSEVVVRANDDEAALKRKVRLAVILGTIQATMTNFRYLRDVWKQNAEEEALLGVSMTGILDNAMLSGTAGRKQAGELLNKLREYAVSVNKEWAKTLGIKPAAAITCVKPSGCRPGTEITATSSGLLTLDELVEGHPQDAQWHDVNNLFVFQGDEQGKVTKTYRNGTSMTVVLRLSYGLELESTPNHKWFVSQRYDRKKLHKYVDVNEWKRADEIDVNDIIKTNTRAYQTELVACLKSIDVGAFPSQCGTISQPALMDADLAWLLGYLWGDGAMSPCKWRLRFTDQNVGNLKRASRIIEEKFAVPAHIHPCSDGRDASCLEIGSRLIWEWMVCNGIWKYEGSGLANIPRVVRSSSWKHIVAFFAGLIDSDGCASVCSDGYGQVAISSAYLDFTKHLQKVSWAIGLCLGFSKNTKGESFQTEKAIYGLWLTTQTDVEVGRLLCQYSSKMSGLPVDRWIFENPTYYLIPGKVTDVILSPELKWTYDLEVESEHWYYSSCAMSHNTVSQLVDCASGIHPRHSRFYIRTVRADKKDPLARFMVEMGFPYENDQSKPEHNWVFSFPMKAPEGAIVSSDLTAVDHLELWKLYQLHWCEHKPSITVNLLDSEWMEAGAWVYRNFDIVSGIAFLPRSGHVYTQAPYQECTEAEYKAMLGKMPKEVDWDKMNQYESEDERNNTKELACTAGVCELVDIHK